jgi:hypothetical protein
VADCDCFVSVVDTNMYLGAADQLLARQQLIVSEHSSVSRRPGDLHFGRHRQRHGPGGHHPYAQLGGGFDEYPSVAEKFIAQPVQGIDDPGVCLDDAALQFGDVLLGQLGQQFGGARGQPPCLQVDKVELLFGT